MWHKNASFFDAKKVPYFNFYCVEAPYVIPLYMRHFPSSTLDTDRMPFASEEGDDLALNVSINVSINVSKFEEEEERNMQSDDVVIMGWNVYQHSLIVGDLIVVHENTAHAIMPDDKKWDRNEDESGNTHPYLCMYLGKDRIIDADGDYEAKHFVETYTGEIFEFYPADIVKNVRYEGQARAAKKIQNTWRNYILTKRSDAATTIQRLWKHYMYKPPTSQEEFSQPFRPGYAETLREWNSLQNSKRNL